MTSSRNIAARMGRWSANHRKLAIFGWLAFVAVAFVLGGMVGQKEIDYRTSGPGESGRARGSSTPGSSSRPARAS